MYTLSLNATSGAAANGAETNTVTATLMNGSTYVNGAILDFRIASGSALFTNGTQTITASTSSLGEASVGLTDTIEESVIVLVILSSDATVYQTVSVTFSAGGSSTHYTLALAASGTAVANGSDTNTATATLLKDGAPTGGEILNFNIVTGSALFTSGGSATTGITDAQGQTTVSFTDQMAETVTIMATLQKDTAVYQTAGSVFSAAAELTVERVYNDNNMDFKIGGPHHLFIGASFYIKLSEQTSSIIWSCADANVEVTNFNGNGIVTIKGTPSSNVISIKFVNGAASGEYDINCGLYLSDVHAHSSGHWPTEADYKNIYAEWGDLSTFGWGGGGIIDYAYAGPYANILCDAVNMSTGVDGRVSSWVCAKKLVLPD